MTRRITIDPITRLEGHGKVEILLDEEGNGQHAFLQVPELRGFERTNDAFIEGHLVFLSPRVGGQTARPSSASCREGSTRTSAPPTPMSWPHWTWMPTPSGASAWASPASTCWRWSMCPPRVSRPTKSAI